MTLIQSAVAAPQGRVAAGVIAALAFMALAAQPLLGEFSYLGNLAAMLRFFTIWGNVAACTAMTLIAMGKPPARGVMAALATALFVIAGIYWGLLAGQHHPQGFNRITNQFHHTIIPAATIIWWLRFTPSAPRTVKLIPAIMIPPLSYGAFALILGQLTGFYAYFFLNLPELGWMKYAISNAALAAFFAALGAALVWAKNRIAWHRGR